MDRIPPRDAESSEGTIRDVAEAEAGVLFELLDRIGQRVVPGGNDESEEEPR